MRIELACDLTLDPFRLYIALAIVKVLESGGAEKQRLMILLI